MNMKVFTIFFIAFCFLLILTEKTYSQNRKPLKFITVDFDEVKAYLYDGDVKHLIVADNKIDSTVINQSGYVLTKSQIRELDKLIIDTNNFKPFKKTDTFYDEFTCEKAFCFSPLHGLVFYKGDKIAGYISICFGCNQVAFDSVCDKQVLDAIEDRICTQEWELLFDSFNLTVDGRFYKVSEFYKLSDAIVAFNTKRYGKNYRKIRWGDVTYPKKK